MTVLALFGMFAVAAPAAAASGASQKTWSGVGPDANWTDASNWVGGVAPSPGDALVFPSGVNQTGPVNDEPAGTVFTSIAITGGAYNLSGNAISLLRGITVSANVFLPEYINMGLTFERSQSVHAADYLRLGGPIVLATGTLTFASGLTAISGVVSGGGGITVAGAAHTGINLSGDNTYDGPTVIKAGTSVYVFAPTALGSAKSGTTVEGSGRLVIGTTSLAEPITLDTGDGTGSPTLAVNFQAAVVTGPIRLFGAGQAIILGPFTPSFFDTLSLDGQVAGEASALVLGAVSLTNPTNTYSGAITVGHDPTASLPTALLDIAVPAAAARVSSVAVNGGVIGTTDADPHSSCFLAAPVNLNGGAIYGASNAADCLSGRVTLGTNGGFLAGIWLKGALEGSGPVYAVGHTRLSGANTFSGPISVGSLVADGNAALGQPSNPIKIGGELDLEGVTKLKQNITLNGIGPVLRVMCSTLGHCGTLTDTGSITVTGFVQYSASAEVVADQGETFTMLGSLQGDSHQSLGLGGEGLVKIPGAQPFQGALSLGRVQVGSSASIDSAASVHTGDLQVSGSHTFSVPLYGPTYYGPPGLENLSGDTTWSGPAYAPSVQVDRGSVTFKGVIGDALGPWGLIKYGPGLLAIAGGTPNTNTAQDLVTDGTVLLEKPSGVPAAPGGLNVSGASASRAMVRLMNSGQLGPKAEITLFTGGTLDLNGHSDTIDTLEMRGGTLSTGTATLTLDGGIIGAGGRVTGQIALGAGPRMVDVRTAGSFTESLTIAATISGSGSGLHLLGYSGPLVIPAGTREAYTGPTVVDGSLQVDGRLTSGPVIVSNFGGIGGTGRVGSLTADGGVAPGDSPYALGATGRVTGSFTASDVTLGSSARLSILISEPDGSCLTCASKLTVLNGVDLSRAPTLSVVDFKPGLSTGSTFTIIDNKSRTPIKGTFNGLPEGAVFLAGIYQMSISYVGGDGNDVVVTVVGAAPATPMSGLTVRDWFAGDALSFSGRRQLATV